MDYYEDNGKIYYGKLEERLPMQEKALDDIQCAYRTTNAISGSQFYGFHRISKDGILRHSFDQYSCFMDGLMGYGDRMKAEIERDGVQNFYQKIVDIFPLDDIDVPDLSVVGW